MNPIDLIRELDRLYLTAKTSDKSSDWYRYFDMRHRVDIALGITRPAA